MMPPTWLLDSFAAVMLVVAAVSAARLGAWWRFRTEGADVDAAHLLMAVAMAGMLASGLRTLPDGAWETVFAVATAWFAWRVVRDARAHGIRALAGGHCAPHLVHAAAMIYMFAALPAGTATVGAGMSGMGAPSLADPTLAFVFALILSAYCVWDIDQLSGRRYSLAVATSAGTRAGAGVAGVAGVAGTAVTGAAVALPARGVLLSPAMTIGCRIAMGVTMAFMLVVMI